MKKMSKVMAVLSAAVMSFSVMPAANFSAETITVSESAAAASAKLAAPENLSGKVSSKGNIVLTWDKVEGADAYRVYIYDSESKKFKTYKSVKSNKCTVKDLEKGKKYYFKVAALKKNSKSYTAGTKTAKYGIKLEEPKPAETTAKPDTSASTAKPAAAESSKWKNIMDSNPEKFFGKSTSTQTSNKDGKKAVTYSYKMKWVKNRDGVYSCAELDEYTKFIITAGATIKTLQSNDGFYADYIYNSDGVYMGLYLYMPLQDAIVFAYTE